MPRHTLQRIGIFGGTFNPPHVGHLIVAESVRESLNLDKICFVPSYISPHKRKGEEGLATHRLRMVRLAIRNNTFFAVSDVEIRRKGTSYTFETLEALHAKYPDAKLFLIIGIDNFAEFHTWKKPQRIAELATLVVMNRPMEPADVHRKRLNTVTKFTAVPDIQISSTEIRGRVKDGTSIRFLVPEPVRRYIILKKLYLK